MDEQRQLHLQNDNIKKNPGLARPKSLGGNPISSGLPERVEVYHEFITVVA